MVLYETLELGISEKQTLTIYTHKHTPDTTLASDFNRIMLRIVHEYGIYNVVYYFRYWCVIFCVFNKYIFFLNLEIEW